MTGAVYCLHNTVAAVTSCCTLGLGRIKSVVWENFTSMSQMD